MTRAFFQLSGIRFLARRVMVVHKLKDQSDSAKAFVQETIKLLMSIIEHEGQLPEGEIMRYACIGRRLQLSIVHMSSLICAQWPGTYALALTGNAFSPQDGDGAYNRCPVLRKRLSDFGSERAGRLRGHFRLS